MSKHTSDGQEVGFVPHHPSSWPNHTSCDTKFVADLKKIIEESILGEIDNVIHDAQECNGSLDHRGYVISIALMCALDAISSYGYGDMRGAQIKPFILAHFPGEYHQLAGKFQTHYRGAGAHSWHLFNVGIAADGDAITWLNDIPCINILRLRDALRNAVTHYLAKLPNDETLRSNTLKRYLDLKKNARRAW